MAKDPIHSKMIAVASHHQQSLREPALSLPSVAVQQHPRRDRDTDFEKTIGDLYHKPRETKVSGSSDEALEYLRVFFNFGYFFHYLPYRFKKSSTAGGRGGYVYSIHTSLAHKTVCALVHVCTLFRFVTVLREVQVTHADPTLYFVIARNFATCIYMFTFMFSFWKNQLVFQDIFKEIEDKSQLFGEASASGKKSGGCGLWSLFTIRTVACAYLLCILYTIISFLNVVFGVGFVRMSEWSVQGLLEKHVSYTRFMFFLEGNATEPTDFDDLIQQTHHDEGKSINSVPMYFLTVIHLGIHFYFKLGAHYADLSILICALTLQHLTRRFTASFQEQHGQDNVVKILEQYNALKIVARKINIGIGAITLCCMLEAMPYYATHIGDILNSSQDWFVRLRYLFFIVNFCSIIFVSADISQKVGLLQDWLSEDSNYNLIPQPKLVVLTNELTYSRIGLSAMGLFNITYGFIGSLVSIVVMYVVIILQFRTSLEACQPAHQ